jgi:hypothetical protein
VCAAPVALPVTEQNPWDSVQLFLLVHGKNFNARQALNRAPTGIFPYLSRKGLILISNKTISFYLKQNRILRFRFAPEWRKTRLIRIQRAFSAIKSF